MTFFRGFLPLFLFIGSLHAQQTDSWTLQECVAYAIENNITIQRSKLLSEVSKNNLNTAQWDYAPDLNLNSNYSWNFGLNIDPVTNQISQQTRQTANISLAANWVLLSGGRKWNLIQQRNLDFLARYYQYEDAVNDISLNVASAYLQILLNKEIAAVAAEQYRVTKIQVDRMNDRVNAGANPEGDLLQLEAQLSRDNQALISARNNYEISKLTLANLLQLEDPESFDVSAPPFSVPEPSIISRNPEGIYSTAVENQPGIKGAEFNLQSADEGVSVAKAGYYPSLSLFAQVATNYSDQIPNVIGTQTAPVQVGQVAATQQDVIRVTQFPVIDGTKPFSDQVTDNLNEFVGLSLRVPIFNRFTVRNAVQNAELQQEIARLDLESEKQNLKQTIYQAHADAKASYNSYIAAQASVVSSKKAFDYAEKRFIVGALNELDFETAKNNLASAQSQMLQAKYDYIFTIKVLEFYLTNQIIEP